MEPPLPGEKNIDTHLWETQPITNENPWDQQPQRTALLSEEQLKRAGLAPWQIDGQKRWAERQAERDRQQPMQQTRGINTPTDYIMTRQNGDTSYDTYEQSNKEPPATNRLLGRHASGQMPYHSTLPPQSNHQLTGSV